jgi:hypothetical protein
VKAFLNRLSATRDVRALGATIGGQLHLENATLTNEGGMALSLEGTEIKDGVLLKGFDNSAPATTRTIG